MYNPDSVLENEKAQTCLGFLDTNRSSYLGQTTRPSHNQQKKRTCRIVDFSQLTTK